jgi:Ulp1 family protease
MGVLDRYKRNMALKSRHARRLTVSKHSLLTRERDLSLSSITNALEFGSGVYMMMKIEMESLLQQKNPCSAYELAVTFEMSEDLKRSIELDRRLDELTSHGKTKNPWSDFIRIMHRHQMLTKSQTKNIVSWEDAKEWLQTAGISLREETLAEKERKSLDVFRLHIAKKTEYLIHRFKLKNFKLRILSQRLAEVSYHQSSGSEIKEIESVEERAYQKAIRLSKNADFLLLSGDTDHTLGANTSKEREEEANLLASSLLRPLNEDEQAIVQDAIYGKGSPSDVIAQVDSDVVVRESMRRLQPGQWLNDEVIHYFLIMLAKRDEGLAKQDPSRGRCHFFKSFFITKLLNEGHANPDIEGTYEYRNVKRWSKKVIGKDLFQLNKIFFPINVGGAHWICVVAFMREKRIETFDSLGGSGTIYMEAIWKYLQDEHLDKKKAPLPDVDKWMLVKTQTNTPRQENGEIKRRFFESIFTCSKQRLFF